MKDKNVEWYLHMRLESLLNDIQKVLSYVNNLEVVAASLYFVVNSLPLGIYSIFMFIKLIKLYYIF